MGLAAGRRRPPQPAPHRPDSSWVDVVRAATARRTPTSIAAAGRLSLRPLYGPVHRPGPGRSGTPDHPEASSAHATRAHRVPPTEAQAHAPRRTRRAGRGATPIDHQGCDLGEPLAQPGLGRAGGPPVPPGTASTPSGRAAPRHVRTPHPAVRTDLADAPTECPALPRVRHDPRRRPGRPADRAARGRSRPATTGWCRARASAGGTRWPARLGAPPVGRRPASQSKPGTGTTMASRNQPQHRRHDERA